MVRDPARLKAYTLRIGSTDQSYVDLDDPQHLEFDYVQRIADLLDVLAPEGERIRVVHVGGAALTIPRYVAATRPRSAQVVLEPDTELTAWIREWLPLPRQSGIKVRGTDGVSGIAALADRHADVVVIDAFLGARVPSELTTTEFFSDVARVLGPRGVAVLNLTDRGPFGYGRRVAAGLNQIFAHVFWSAEPSTLKGRRFGNVIVAASVLPLPIAAYAQRAGSGPYPYRVLHGTRLDQLVAGARPFSGSDVAASPHPPFDFFRT
ncbi:MAG TPA: fused MFS/spermidine synthase [Microlunatus sp.]|nr:fused MFS/spermidine synthase [Microlunatus sp.]